MHCEECGGQDKYMIRVATGVQWVGDPPHRWRYSCYADGRIEEKYICPACLRKFPIIYDTSKGTPVDEVEES